MEITRGSLDEITRGATNNPQNNRHVRPGSRVSLHSARSTSSASLYRRSPLDNGSSLEILPPEDISFQDHDIEVEEFFSGSDDDEYDEVSDSQDGIPQSIFTNHHLALRLHDADDPGSDSAASSTPDDPNGNDNPAEVNGNEEDIDTDPSIPVDPKIEEAMRKMRQLDRILAKKVKREKEVKKQRLDLHRQLQRELEGAKPEGRDEQKEISDNTSKFLALVPPNSHNEGVKDEDLPSVSPVFATQPPEAGHRNGKHAASSDGGDMSSRSNTDGTSTNRSTSTTTSNGHNGSKASKKNKSGRRRGRSQEKDGNKMDFVKRNIELATDASNLIAMTDDEKKRLEDLLQDVEMLGDEAEEEPNPFHLQLQICPGIGYQPDVDEQKMLQDIDAKLQALMPPEDFISICSTPTQDMLSNFGGSMSDAYDLGEKILQDNKQGRSQQERLQMIEEELSQMQSAVEIEMQSPRISDARMSEILRQCDDLSSRATSATSSYVSSSTNPTSPGKEGYEVVPRLSDDVLQSLLNEARDSGITTNRSLSTVNEEGDVRDIDLESESMTGRSAQSGALVSYDMIQELLKNPRARSAADSTPAIESARSEGDQTMTPSTPGDRFTPSRSNGDLEQSHESSELGVMKRTVRPSKQGSIQDSTHRASSSNRVSVKSPRSSYDLELEAVRRSAEFDRSTPDYQTGSHVAPASSINNSLDHENELRPSKTRGSSRIAFAESNIESDFNAYRERRLAEMRSGENATRMHTIPTPPKMSHSSPQQSELPRKSRSKKSKSRASSSKQFTPSPGPTASQDQDLRLTSVSASTSYASVTDRTDSQASENTLVSSSDFEYEDDQEVMKEVLRGAPGSENSNRSTTGVNSSLRLREDERETPPFALPLPKLNRGVRGNKPALPADLQKIKGIETYAKSDDDSEKNFSPVFF